MANGITKDDLKEVLHEVRREDMGHNNYYNVPPGEPVTKAINNPMVWISGYAVILGFLGVLIYAIYTSDKNTQNGKIDGNTELIKEIQETQKENQSAQDAQNDLIIKMQGNQERIAEQIEKNGETLEDMRENASDIRGSRFTDKDGANLKDELEAYIRDMRDELIKDITNLQADQRALDTKFDHEKEELTLLKSRVQRNEDELDDRSNFIEDMKERVKTLEMKGH
jgi:chromosome segregation ATPase